MLSNQHQLVCVDQILEPLLPGFIQNRWKDLDLLKKYLHESDYISIDNLIHKLQGTAGTFGFNELVDLAKNLNLAIKLNDLTKIESILSEYEFFMKHFKIKIIP